MLTRGGEESPAEEVARRRRHPPHPRAEAAHRPRRVRRLGRADELRHARRRASSSATATSFDLVHGHDWLVANACDHLARRFGAPLVTTIHATEYGRHQGWVDKHPQSYIHGVERWITNRSDRVIACSHYMREQIADIFGVDGGADRGDPERDRPRRPAAPGRRRAGAPARRVRRARREARAADRPPRLREGLPARAGGDAAADRGGCPGPASWSPAPAPTRPSCAARPRSSG